MDDKKAVEFQCQLKRVRTMADGTVDVTLNLPEYSKEQVKVMFDWLLWELRGWLTVAENYRDRGGENGL